MMNNFTDKIKKLFNSRSLKYGSNSIILIAVVVAIVVFINMLISPTVLKKITGKEAIKWDLTPNKLFTIGDMTKQILKDNQKEITIYGLFDETKIDAELKEVNELLKQYQTDKVKIKYVDLDKEPGFLKSIDPENMRNIQREDIVFVSGKKVKKLSRMDLFKTEFDSRSFREYKTGSAAEQSFTGAVKYVTSDKTPVVYFLQGHDEKNLTEDYKSVAEYLQRNNYEAKSVNLATVAKVPEDAEILMVAAPKIDLNSDEKEKVKTFLKDGGKAIFAFDPLDKDPKLSNFEDVLSSYNVSLNYDRVKENDEKRHIKNKPNDILPDVQVNSINKPLNPEDLLMIMPKSRSINILKNQKEYVTVTSLMKTSDRAVGEVIDKTRGKDLTGPLDLAVAVEYKGGAKPSKILVLGNGSFMTDNAIKQYEQYSVNGLYFFLNSVGWMQDQQQEVMVAPKAYANNMLQMSQSTANVVMAIVLITIPLLVFCFGTFVWMRRRHL